MSTINTTDREIVTNIAIFSELSYADNKNIKLPPGNWKPLVFKNEEKNIIGIDGLDNPQTGYQARAWVNTDTRQIYFANTGTNDFKEVADWLAAQRGAKSSQFADALDAGLKVKELVETEDGKYQDYKIIVTGHSWGELMAQTLSHTFGWRGVGFDGPGAQKVINDPLYAQLTSERGIMPVGNSDFISCNVKNLGPLGGGLVGHTGTDIAGTRQCEITTNRIIEYSALSFGLAIVMANPLVGFVAGRIIGGVAQHSMQGLRSAVEQGNFSVGGDTHSSSTKVLPYEYQDAYGNRLRTLQDAQGNPLLADNGKLLCQLTLCDKSGSSQETQFTLDGTLIQQTTTYYEQNQVKQITTRDWLTDNVYQSHTYDRLHNPTPISSSLNFGPINYSLADFSQRSIAEYRLHQLNQNGGLWYNRWHDFTRSTSNWLLNEGWRSDGIYLKLPSNWLNPIGAFYDSQSTAHDLAPSIADKTTRAMHANGQALFASQLAALDTDQDGQLSTSEAASVRFWADKNEDGRIDSGELLNVNTPIKSADYAFYTRSNGQAVSAANPVAPPAYTPNVPAYTGVPTSNYWHWRTTAELFPTHAGFFMWQLNQVMLTWNNNQYDNLVGTEGNDIFDINYYASVHARLNVKQKLHLVKNFMAGAGDDVMGGSERSDNLWGGTGNDTLYGYAGDDKLYGEEGDDVLFGQDGNDLLDGGVGNDTLLGGNGDDVIWGGEGADELQGNDGHDKLIGGAGNDKLFGQVGNDTLLGGDGDDILVGFTLSNEAKQSLAAGESDDDILSGGNGNDNLYGGVGNDQLMGDAGDDLLLGNDGHDRLWGGDGKDELQGGAGDDQLDGGAGDDRLFGQVGNDIIWGGAGNDLLMGFTGSNETKQSLAAGETDDDILYGGAGSDVLIGGLGQDTLYGGADRDELQGGEGNDILFGEAGDDNLFGQVGNDILYGGDGDDYLQGFTGSNEAKQTLAAGESDDDFLYGGAGNDTLVGGVGNDYLDGGAGADIMIGGQGDDVYIVNSVNDTIYEKAGEGYDTVITSSNYLLNANIEELRLLEGYNIHATGNALNNKLIGNSADNILDGVTGADTMIGGGGHDTYYVDNADDVVIEYSGEGNDTVQSSISYTLGEHVENLVLLDFAKPEKGLVDGKAVLVYGYPKRNELDYMQGDAVENYAGTCALTSIANVLIQAGRFISERQVVQLAINNNWAINDPSLPASQLGGSNVNDQRNILNKYGFRNDIVMGYNEAGLANLLRSGRGVILAVNAGALWGDRAYTGNGAVNHAVTLTGAVYDEAKGTLVGFYLADSGRGKVSDMTRFVDIATFRKAANVPNAYALYTIEPVKYWQENINGTGNAQDNQLVGNRGNNTLSGMAGNDVINGEGGDDTLYGVPPVWRTLKLYYLGVHNGTKKYPLSVGISPTNT